jgi:hypothetical protein
MVILHVHKYEISNLSFGHSIKQIASLCDGEGPTVCKTTQIYFVTKPLTKRKVLISILFCRRWSQEASGLTEYHSCFVFGTPLVEILILKRALVHRDFSLPPFQLSQTNIDALTYV